MMTRGSPSTTCLCENILLLLLLLHNKHAKKVVVFQLIIVIITHEREWRIRIVAGAIAAVSRRINEQTFCCICHHHLSSAGACLLVNIGLKIA